MDMSAFVSNRFQARCKLVYFVAVAIFNASYVSYILADTKKSDTGRLVVTQFEFWAVVAIFFKAATHLCAVLFCNEACAQAFTLVQDLEDAGSFSMFWFLPLPSKFIYWYNNKTFLLEEYIWDPPCTCLHWVPARNGKNASPQFRPWLKDHWVEIYENGFRSNRVLFIVGILPTTLGWIIIRVVQPMFIVLCVVLALPITIIKLSTLSPLENKISGWHTVLMFPILPKSWILTDYFKALGLLCQMSKVWSPQSIENVGYMRHISECKMGDGQAIVSGRAFRRNIIQCCYRMFYANKLDSSDQSILDVLSFFAVFDIGTIGKVLNKGFTLDTPYGGLHHVKVDKLDLVWASN